MATEDDIIATGPGQKRAGLFRYAVIDLASAVSLRPIVPALLSTVAEPLFARSQPLALLQVGPWLVDLDAAPQVAKVVAGHGTGVPWGYYLHSSFDLVSVRQSLRKFNLAKVPGYDREVLFRYWDPRVIGLFLDGTTTAQRAKFFEWIELVELADGSLLDGPSRAEQDR